MGSPGAQTSWLQTPPSPPQRGCPSILSPQPTPKALLGQPGSHPNTALMGLALACGGLAHNIISDNQSSFPLREGFRAQRGAPGHLMSAITCFALTSI